MRIAGTCAALALVAALGGAAGIATATGRPDQTPTHPVVSSATVAPGSGLSLVVARTERPTPHAGHSARPSAAPTTDG